MGDDWDILRKFYKEQSKGPAKHEVGERLGLNKLYEGSDHYIFLYQKQKDRELADMERREQIAKGLCENAKEMLKEEREKNQEEVKHAREKA